MNTRCGAWAVGAIVLAGSLVGCGNMVQTEITGIVGVVLDAQGSPVLMVDPCGATFDRITVVALDRPENSPEATNTSLLTLTSSSPLSSRFTVDPGAPTAPWSADRPLPLRDAHRAVIDVSSTSAQRGTTPVEVSDAAYEKLVQGDVLVRQGEVWTRAEFDQRACRPDTWPAVNAS
ncbi:hypothetical protein [Nostocoides jenkinsii]|uniref:Lipoprotein n=1 Tax=Nostocoides jenkinsii Ben 74 TaxID=1193518 RepID=A0A077M7R3_9MICO|nr:hypothetical protein [Tetrasphaera jenkinsii]CCI51870.1 exported hypothetical protein [Tetrasphaera jenkinsii Ben 74]